MTLPPPAYNSTPAQNTVLFFTTLLAQHTGSYFLLLLLLLPPKRVKAGEMYVYFYITLIQGVANRSYLAKSQAFKFYAMMLQQKEFQSRR